MLYAGLAIIVAWGVIVIAFGAYLARSKAPGWVHRTINISAATIAVLLVVGFVAYAGLHELLAETSLLWNFS